jgi:hypothetical protein
MTTSQVIELATRIQRRRDFTAHLLGFLAGATALTTLHVLDTTATTQFAGSMLAWATALSSQHFRHVLRGPVTSADVNAEHARLTSPVPDSTSRRQGQAVA